MSAAILNYGDADLKEKANLISRMKSVKHYLETFRKPKIEGCQEQGLTSKSFQMQTPVFTTK